MSLKQAAIINGISRFSKIFIQLFVNAILARILSPAEYGVVTIITVFSTFFNTFADMGFGAAVIQHKNLSKDDINSIYSLTVYMGAILGVVFCIISIPIATFYENNAYLTLGPLLALSLLFNTLNMVPNSILMRDKKFVPVAVRTIVVYLGGGIVAIILALLDFSYYALVFQTVLIAFVSFLWNYISTRPKFVLKINIRSLQKVAQFSMFQFAFNIINYFSRNLDNLLTGKFLGDVQLAYYDKAYTLMLYPVNNLTGVISPVLHPILSDYQDDPKYIYNAYVKISKILGILGVYVSAFCFLAASELIMIFYGPQWGNAVICFKALSLVVAMQMINSCSGSIFQSLGNTRLLFMSGLINASITVVMILIGLLAGKSIYALAACVAIAYLLHFLTAQFIAIHYGFGYKVINYYKDLKYEIVLYVVLLISCVVYPFNISNFFVSFCIKLAWISFITFAVLFFTKEYRILLEFVVRRRKK